MRLRRARDAAVVALAAGLLAAAAPSVAYAHTAAAPPATLEMAASPNPRRAGAATVLVGHLVTADIDPLPGEPVELLTRTSDTAEWTYVSRTTTDAHGAAAFQVRPQSTATYLLRHPATATADAASGGAFVEVGPAQTTPAPPERVVADAGDAAVRVSWLPPADDGGVAVTSYRVTATSPAGTREVTVDGAQRAATVTGLANDAGYTVSVTATTAQGSATQARGGHVTPRAGAGLPSVGTGTPVCGRLPFGVTRLTAAASPYLVCPLGLIVPLGATLVVDGADVRFRGSRGGYPEPYGLDVAEGALQLVDSTLRGEIGRRGEWRGIVTDGRAAYYYDQRVPATLSATRSTVRDVISGVYTAGQPTLIRLTDTVLANASQHGLSAFGRVRATRLTVRDVGWEGVSVWCWTGNSLDRTRPCPVALDGVTVERAGRRGLTVDTPGPVTVKNVVVTGSGTVAPVSEAARFANMSASFGPGADIEEVRGGGNGLDAVVLDATATNDVVWRTPAVTPITAPAPLGYVLERLALTAGRTITFPAGSVVKSVLGRYDCRTAVYEHVDYTRAYPCHGSVEAAGATIDASAPGTVFTGAADDSVGMRLCPSRIQPSCGGTGPWWNGLAIRGDGARATLTGATVRGAAVGLHARVLGPQGLAVSVTGTAFQRSEQALVVEGLGDAVGSAALADVTVTDSPVGIRLSSLATVDVARTTVRRSGGVLVTGANAWHPCDGPTAVSLSDLLVEDAPAEGLTLDRLCHPLVRRVTVRRSGLPGPDARIAGPAVAVKGGTATFGPAGDVDGVTGGGNGMDAIGLAGIVDGPLQWVSPYNATGDHPLGYVVGTGLDRGGQLRVTGAHAVTVPAGALVASYGGALSLEGAPLDAAAGGARFVSVLDPLAGELGCRLSCGPSTWGGVVATGPELRLGGATVRGGPVDFSGGPYAASGSVRIADSSFDTAVVRRPKSVSVTGSRLSRLEVLAAHDIDVSRNTVTDDGSISLEGSGDYGGGPVYLRDNAAAAGQARPAYSLANAKATFGPGGTVYGNTGAGANAVLRLSGVTTDADLTWLTPTQDPRPHPVGYAADSLVVRGPRTLRVPAGGIVKATDIRLEGARLDATAGGATFTGLDDDTAGLSVCGPVSGCDASDTPRPRAAIRSVAQTSGSLPGAIGIERARVLAFVSVDGPATDAPGAPGFGLAIRDSYVQGGVVTTATNVSVTGTRMRTGAIQLNAGRSVVRDVLSEDATRPSVDLRSGYADVSRLVVRRNTADSGGGYPGAVSVSGYSSGGTFGCLDVRDNVRGIAVNDIAITISDSALTGNAGPATSPYGARYDLDNHPQASATTSGVWWGQPGGPLPGQVRDPAKHTDLAPRDAAPACAVADAKAPPGPARAVAATGGVRSVRVTWREPATDGGSPVTSYRVALTPGTTVVVGPGERAATFSGLTPGVEHFATVTPVNAVAPGPESKAAAARPTAESPSPSPSASATPTGSPTPTASPTGSPTATPTASPSDTPTGTPTASPTGPAEPPAERAMTDLSVAAPGLVTYGTAAVVSGRLTAAGAGLPDRDVTVHVRPVGHVYWTTVATVRTSPTGTVAYAVRLGATSEVHLGYAGDATTLPTSSVLRVVQVRPVVSAVFSRTSIAYGYSTGLYGRVSPSLAGRPVRLERYTSDGWRPITRTYLTATSNYRFGVKPGARGTFYYRVVHPATTTHARAVSPTRALTVR